MSFVSGTVRMILLVLFWDLSWNLSVWFWDISVLTLDLIWDLSVLSCLVSLILGLVWEQVSFDLGHDSLDLRIRPRLGSTSARRTSCWETTDTVFKSLALRNRQNVQDWEVNILFPRTTNQRFLFLPKGIMSTSTDSPVPSCLFVCLCHSFTAEEVLLQQRSVLPLNSIKLF